MPIKRLQGEDGENIVRIEIDDFRGGLELSKDDIKMAENEFLALDNFEIFSRERQGSARLRNAYVKYNTNAVSSGTSIRSILEYISHNKASNFSRLLVKTNNALCYCEGTGAFSTIKGSMADCKLRGNIFGDNAYLVNVNNGGDSNLFYDGTNILDVGTPPTPQTFLIAEGPNVASPSVTHLYIVTYLYDNGVESYPILPNYLGNTDRDSNNNGALGSAALEVNFRTVITTGSEYRILSNLPVGNARVKARKIYRTKDGANVFYFHSTINDNTTTTYTDKKADDELTQTANFEYIFKPKTARHSCTHKGFLVQGDLKENAYETAPSIADVNGSSSYSGSYAGINYNATRQARYSYKFANIYLITGFEGNNGKPYTGFIGKKSSAYTHTVTATHNTLSLSGINNSNEWALKVAVFRNICQFIDSISVSGTTLTISTVTGQFNVGNPGLKNGETVTISGVSGFGSNPNGTYVISNVTNVTTNIVFDITHNTVSGSYTANTGRVEGSNFYYVGVTATNGTTFVDTVPDSLIIMPPDQLSYLVEKNTDDYKRSAIQISRAGQGDVFVTSTEDRTKTVYADDNDVLTGLVDSYNGVWIFKENNICKLFTNAYELSTWPVQKIVEGIGATDDDNVNSIVRISDGEFIFKFHKQFFHLIGDRCEPCSDNIQPDLDAITITRMDGVYDKKNFCVRYTYDTASVTGNELIYDLTVRNEKGHGKFRKVKENISALQLGQPFITNAGELIYGHKKEYLFKIGTGYQDLVYGDSATFVSENVKGVIQTKKFTAEHLILYKISGRIYSSAGGNISVIYLDNSGVETTKTVTIAAGYGTFNTGVNSRYKQQSIKLVFNINSSVFIQMLAMDFIIDGEETGV